MEPIGTTTLGHSLAQDRLHALERSAVAAGKADHPKLMEAAKQFESYFYSALLSEMRKSLPGNPVMSGGRGEEVFQGQLDNELANRMGERGALGIARMIYNQLIPKDGTVHMDKAVEQYARSAGDKT